MTRSRRSSTISYNLNVNFNHFCSMISRISTTLYMIIYILHRLTILLAGNCTLADFVVGVVPSRFFSAMKGCLACLDLLEKKQAYSGLVAFVYHFPSPFVQ
ncbi:hypothetical protein Dimus_024206 [Dionaea muscipula]